MLGFGVKRKLADDEDLLAADGGVLSSALRRQTLLNVSLGKLYAPRTGADLGLQRRVLINNIVRRLHADLRQHGGADATAALFFFSATPPVANTTSTNEDESFHPPPPASSFSLLSSPLTPASLLEDDLPVFFAPSPQPASTPRPPSPPPPPKDSFSSALEEIEELCPSPPHAPSLRRDIGVKEEGCGLQEKAPPPLLPLAPSPAGSFLTDFALDDVLFTDIDTSMYDVGARPGAQTQPFKMDLAELDQIMEVLVGS
ncbi:SERTA domain-containing protein 2-like [Sander lucioperca]|uniref:SERTA domain-containing protein 2-like n=1 Tax=Sander lucioperca TaxID=283035 RepID=A0A8C9XS61_SANLU|nr:SERTA domain-containing protein 2-like [Sander lucioperca]